MRPSDQSDWDVSAHARGLEALSRWSGQARVVRQQLAGAGGASVASFAAPIASAEEVWPGVEVVALTGIVDAYSVATLCDELVGLAHEQRHLIVDLAEVGMLDSSGLSALLATAIALRERGASLTVVAGSAQVMHGFELSGLDLPFRVEGSRGDAPAALRTAAAAP